MKKRFIFTNKNTRLVIIILVGLTVTLIALLSIISTQVSISVLEFLSIKLFQLSSTPVTLNAFISKITLTPTLDLSGIPLATPGPSTTPLVLSSTIDLSPNIDRLDKFDIYVRHPDGTVTLFLIGPLRPGWEVTADLSEEILQKLPLKEGDVILFWQPPSPWRRIESPPMP